MVIRKLTDLTSNSDLKLAVYCGSWAFRCSTETSASGRFGGRSVNCERDADQDGGSGSVVSVMEGS